MLTQDEADPDRTEVNHQLQVSGNREETSYMEYPPGHIPLICEGRREML